MRVVRTAPRLGVVLGTSDGKGFAWCMLSCSATGTAVTLAALSRREWIGFAAAAVPLALLSRTFARAASNSITPEEFGAVGDGVTNDTDAFAAMSDFINKRNGGTIVLRRATYIVGKQSRNPKQFKYSFLPIKIIELNNCTGKIAIFGNGARLRCSDGLRYGTFDASSGRPTFHPLPNYNATELATPYAAMIKIENCSGGIDISELELDGNLSALTIGGAFGDTGHQIPAFGLQLIDNNCSEHIEGVYTHHHALDGMHISGFVGRTSSSVTKNVVSEYNARQGCSVTGGCNYWFVNCRFNHTGRAGLVSLPGAGVDIEAEDKTVRNLSFSGCEFSNNAGPGMIADSGDTEGATFDKCRFIGTTDWAAWPGKPHFRFTDCVFIGSICNTYGSQNPSRAVHFRKCDFFDDPALSPTRQVYLALHPIADLSTQKNILFDGCRFKLTAQSVLPWTLSVIYNNCTMSQVQAKQAYPRGTFMGVNTIHGNVDLYGSKIVGSVIVNGRLLARTTK